MPLQIRRVEVFATNLQDRPGDLARVLGELADRGANVECVIARRQSDRSGAGVAFISTSGGGGASGAAGMDRAESVSTLRVEGDDRPGLGAELCQAVADAGINLRGLSAAVLSRKFVAYFGFDNDTDADRAADAMRGVKTGSRSTARPGGATRGRAKTGARAGSSSSKRRTGGGGGGARKSAKRSRR